MLADVSGRINMWVKEDLEKRKGTDGEEAIIKLMKEENVLKIKKDLNVQSETIHRVPSRREEEKTVIQASLGNS